MLEYAVLLREITAVLGAPRLKTSQALRRGLPATSTVSRASSLKSNAS
jgi:hypothetical protein